MSEPRRVDDLDPKTRAEIEKAEREFRRRLTAIIERVYPVDTTPEDYGDASE